MYVSFWCCYPSELVLCVCEEEFDGGRLIAMLVISVVNGLCNIYTWTSGKSVPSL